MASLFQDKLIEWMIVHCLHDRFDTPCLGDTSPVVIVAYTQVARGDGLNGGFGKCDTNEIGRVG